MILINNKEFNKLRYSDIEKFLNDSDLDESFFVEFKRDDVSSKTFVKEICAFANTFGGYIFLGVEDDKTITGCANWTEEKINNVVRDSISPMPSFDVKRLSNDEMKIYVIRIDEGVMPPYITSSGIIYERLSSSSNPVKDSATINRILEKRKNNLKRIENKIYIDPIVEKSCNLCGYLDFGFSVVSRDNTKIIKKMMNADFRKVSEFLKESGSICSISKVGYSICVTFGVPKYGDDLLVPAGCNNFMEILPDGSVRGRIIFTSPSNDNNSNFITAGYISLISHYFQGVYSLIFNGNFSSNFVEARKYEKLVVLKMFESKILTNQNDKFYNQFENFYLQNKEKYGSNIVINSNRIPMNDFYVIDKKSLQERKIRYNDNNLFEQLFKSAYFLLGFIDNFSINEID